MKMSIIMSSEEVASNKLTTSVLSKALGADQEQLNEQLSMLDADIHMASSYIDVKKTVIGESQPEFLITVDINPALTQVMNGIIIGNAPRFAEIIKGITALSKAFIGITPAVKSYVKTIASALELHAVDDKAEAQKEA